MNYIVNFISKTNNILWSYILIALLIFMGLYFTIKSHFVQFKYLGEMFKLLFETSSNDSNKNHVSSFQAFCISVASRVGTGNLAGVAIAISVGGPGAVFWMWLIALIGAASSFIESTLAQIYKVKDKNGFRGGPAYYMEKGLNKKWMGILFSILITISFGLVFNSVQANTIALAFEEAFSFNKNIMALILGFLTLIIIFGGIKRIAKVSSFIVPIMALSYLAVAFFVIFKNISILPSTLKLIIENAFGIKQSLGGTLGATIMMGIKRGLFSNEAGMGSAPNAAATAEVSHPVKQGLVQTLGVFTDTIIICSATAFIILLSGVYTNSKAVGIQLTQKALCSQIGPFGNIFIAICIFLFAFSSVIGNYYYGEANIQFMSNKKIILFIYRLLVVLIVMFGSITKVQLVWDMADLFMGLMALINLIAIFKLRNISFQALHDYSLQKLNKKDPIFKKDNIKNLYESDLHDIECW